MAAELKYSLRAFAGFCRKLKLPNGKPMRLEAFQRRMLRDYFAGVRELVIVIPKKNGKTTLLAALALFHVLRVPDADCVIVANSRDQAMKLFDEARKFVQRSPELQAELRPLRGYREIRRRDPDDPDNPKAFIGIVRVLAADADTADGWGGTLALVDELHRADDSELYGVLFDGLGPRAGQIVTISTAGVNEDTPLGHMRDRAHRIPKMARQGCYRYATSGRFSWHEWALEANEDLENLRVVKRANPASWQTLEELELRRHSLGMTAAQWARFACGVWGIGGEPAWDWRHWNSLALERTVPDGAGVVLGFDGARRRDTTGLVACEIETGHLFPVGFWPRPLDADEDWEAPEDEVSERVDWAFEKWNVWRLYGDPPYWETALDRWAGKHGSEKVIRWWTNRNKAMAMALRAFTGDMRPEEMSHDGDEDLAAHIRNAIRKATKMREDDEPLWLIRKASKDSPHKIDLAMAAVLAWEARGDALRAGDWAEPEYERAAW